MLCFSGKFKLLIGWHCLWIPGGKKRDTQMASNGSFWNTKGQCLHHLTTLFLAKSNFTMMVRLYLLQNCSIYTSVCGFTVEPGVGMLVTKLVYFEYFR